ncbi:MAG: lactonase family protein [Chloroflexia bacterium]
MSLENVVYIGTYTKALSHTAGKAEGIYRCRFDPASGALTVEGAVAGVDNPSFLALDPQKRYLYAVEETDDYEGRASGAVSAFAVDPDTGDLTWLNRQATGGTAPCHVSVDPTGRWVLVANYGSGSISVYPIEEGGRLGAASAFVQHEGGSVNPQRQQGPHAHMIVTDPGNRRVLVNDLGLDKVLLYQLDAERGTLTPNDPPWGEIEPGGGPRHLAFHPGKDIVYVLHEIGSAVTTFAYDPDSGALTALQTLPSLPADFAGNNSTADIHVAASGRFVYGSNRGHDSIAIFAVDDVSGTLTALGHVSTGGQTPRNFSFDPSGNYVLAANQRTDNIVSFRVDQGSGGLTPTGHDVQVPTPVCILFAGQ